MQRAFDFVQRWRAGRDTYRPAGEVIATRDYEVVALTGDRDAKTFVQAHHYSGSFPAARFRFGLYRHDALVGVAVFSHPCNDRVLTAVFPGDPCDSVELGRFVLLDDVPANGETWFLGQCFRTLKRTGLRGILSFSDPVPRRAATGQVVFPGHLGIIYQAHNGAYLGRGPRRSLRLLPDGQVFSARAIQKLRSGDKGWRYAAARLERFGAAPAPTATLARRTWLTTWLPRLTRTIRHTGNHKYAWSFERRLVSVADYPKGDRCLRN